MSESIAATQSIHVEWGYTPPSQPAVSAFTLYQEGGAVCQTADATATAMDCSVELHNEPTTFTLTARFADGTESPHSAPFSFSPSESAEQGGSNTVATSPLAVITTSVAAGECPLSVSFDGIDSVASLGSTLVNYSWNFGEDSTGEESTGEGEVVTHVYSEPGTYTVTLTVTDSAGKKSSITTPVVAREADATAANVSAVSKVVETGISTTSSGTVAVNNSITPTTGVHLEVGEILATDEWAQVSFDEPYSQPIVVAGPPQSSEAEPCTVRIRNVTSGGFEIRLVEWPGQDGEHVAEKVSYLALEQGISRLADGTVVMAGMFASSTSWQKVNFSQSWSENPVILTSITTNNNDEAVAGRVIPGTSSFAYLLQAGEGTDKATVRAETVHYVALEPGVGRQGFLQYEARANGVSVDNGWKSVDFTTSFLQAPMLFAGLQSYAGSDTAALRTSAVKRSQFQIKVEEEQSLNNEVAHPAEEVCYLAIAPTGPARLATFSWDFDAMEDEQVEGFKVLADGEEICATDDPSARSLSCTIVEPSSATSFTVLAVMGEDEESAASNAITYSP
nr:PKD domain-containing protein [uncultured Desulfobulbus sp.]